VQSAVIYLRKPGSSKAKSPYQVKLPNGKVVHEFSFSVIELCKMEAEQLFQTGLKGLLPLIPLTQDGQQHDVVERVIDELQQPGVKKSGDWLSLTYNLAGLVSSQKLGAEKTDHLVESRIEAPSPSDDQHSQATLPLIIEKIPGLVFEGESEQLWLVRRFEMLKDILEESWTYQRIKEEGREEGQLQGQRQALLLLIQTRYSALVQLAEDVCNAIRILEELQDLFQKVLLAKDEQEVRQLLMSVQK